MNAATYVINCVFRNPAYDIHAGTGYHFLRL